MSVEKCPVCQGTGNVPGGFYNSIAGHIYIIPPPAWNSVEHVAGKE